MSDHLEQKSAALSRTVLFGTLAAQPLRSLALSAEWRVMPSGGTIFRKGDPGDLLFVIHRGRVKIGYGSSDGREVVLNLLGPPAVFGEVAVADGGVRTADATAVEVTELVSIGRRELFPFLRENPEAALQMMIALSSQVRWIAESFDDRLFLDLAPRLAKRLVFLGTHFGQHTDNGLRLGLSLPHRELAAHMNVTRESVNRLLQKWRKDGLIEERRGVMFLKSLAALQKIALKS